MKKAGKSEADMKNVTRLFTEIYQQIDSKQLRPTMRTQYNRVAYQIPFDATVRVSLDTNLLMIAENPKVGPDCQTESRWYRNPNITLPPTEFTTFPHAVLEVKLSLKEGEEAPQWVTDLINSGYVTQVHKFSKFIHGCATLLSEDVQAVPYWVDDESIRPSMLRSQPRQKKRSLMGIKKNGSVEIASNTAFGFGAHEPIQLMERKPSLVPAAYQSSSANGYGTVGERTSLTSEFPVFVREDEGGFFGFICEPIKRCLFGGSHQVDSGYKPRKTPMKVEPKVFLANERTLLSWLHMAITLGSISAALLGFSGVGNSTASGAAVGLSKGQQGARVIGLLLLPVAILFCGYALVTFYWRGKRIRSRTEGIFHDEVGPFLLGTILIISLIAVFLIYLTEGTAIHV